VALGISLVQVMRGSRLHAGELFLATRGSHRSLHAVASTIERNV